LHRASLVPSSDRGWITATLRITTCQASICKGYRECRILLHELFAKLHDANITQPSFLRISVGYRCVAESNTRLPSVLCYKAVKLQQPSYLTGLLSSYRQSHVLRSSTSDLYFQHSLRRQTLLLVGSHATPQSFGTVFPHLYALLILQI